MLSILKKLFRKSEPQPVAPVAATRAVPRGEPAAPLPSVEVAHLSLAAIISRFPAELKASVVSAPDAAATIALPLLLIHRQLASGTVRMSYASLHRQAPQGVFAPITMGDKRQVEIPLQEIFRHVSPQALKRRVDQRQLDLADNDFNLFGNEENPYEIAPTTPDNPPPRPPRKDSTVLNLQPAPAPASRSGRPDLSAPPAPSGIKPPNGMRTVAPPADFATTAPPAAFAPSDEPPLILPLARLSNAWPEQICGEITAFDAETTVALDAGVVAAGLARGKVTFTWGQICAGLAPAPAEPSAFDADTLLTLPLKVVAPAFLAATSKAKSGRKAVQIDESIPALFNDGREPAPVVADIPPPVEELPAEPGPEPVAEPMALATAPAPGKIPETVGEIFGEPDRLDFTPAEIVAGTVKLPGVAGATVALQEGLAVATSLPEGVKGDVVAAFLPQIFARLNQYAGEMKLGEVDDLLFTTHGAHCQIYRLGFIYFAILGHPGAALPWHELRLIAAELGRQTQP